LLVPRIGETSVTVVGFLGSSIGLAIFSIGAVSGNQVLASVCAGLLSMSGMVLPHSAFSVPWLFTDRVLHRCLQLTSRRYFRLFEPLYPAALKGIFKAPYKPRWASCRHSPQRLASFRNIFVQFHSLFANFRSSIFRCFVPGNF